MEMEVTPDPKPPVKRKPGRTFRKRGDKAGWERLREQKLYGKPCRLVLLCGKPAKSLHHLLPRSLGGDDVADNLVGLCGDGTSGCHGAVEDREPAALLLLANSLDDGEYAYLISKCGEGAMERLFNITDGSLGAP